MAKDTRLTRISVVYLVVFLLFFLVIPDFLFSFKMYLSGNLVNYLSYSVIVLWAGKILDNYQKVKAGKIVRWFLSPFLFFVLASLLLASLIAPLGPRESFVAFSGVILLGLGVSAAFTYLSYLGSGTHFEKWIKRVLIIPFLMSAAVPIASSPTYAAASFLFIVPSITIGVFSLAPYLYYSDNKFRRRIGGFLYYSYDRWIVISVVLGIMASLLVIRKPVSYNVILVVLFLAGITLMIFYLSYKVVVLGSHRIETLKEKIYPAYKYKVTVFQSESEEFMSCANEFMREGKPERLILSLGMLLSSMNVTFREAELLLSSLIKYSEEEIFKWNVLNMKETLKMLMEKRAMVLDSVLSEVGRWARKM